MKKIFTISGFFLFCAGINSPAQTSTTTGTPVSASKDVIVTGTAVVEKTDSTGSSVPAAKNARSTMMAAPGENEQSPDSDKISTEKKPL